jgi:hypothetical protein
MKFEFVLTWKPKPYDDLRHWQCIRVLSIPYELTGKNTVQPGK